MDIASRAYTGIANCPKIRRGGVIPPAMINCIHGDGRDAMGIAFTGMGRMGMDIAYTGMGGMTPPLREFRRRVYTGISSTGVYGNFVHAAIINCVTASGFISERHDGNCFVENGFEP